jgi:Undecaprenyl-phosphate galactose phosphotransferase WbaP
LRSRAEELIPFATKDEGGAPRLPLEVCAALLGGRQGALKRLFDILLASLLLPAALVLGLLIAAAIKAETPGRVFFSQTRVGRGGRRFRLWKFRSMSASADAVLDSYLRQHPEYSEEWRRSHKLKNDPRVTRVGRLLRRSSLDELPQLWNVLRGDMSMVGPRPIVEAELPKYGRAVELYSQVRPGLTGLWQVSGRNDTSYRKRVDLDSEYITRWSPRLDAFVLLKTIRVVLLGHGAY